MSTNNNWRRQIWSTISFEREFVVEASDENDEEKTSSTQIWSTQKNKVFELRSILSGMLKL